MSIFSPTKEEESALAAIGSHAAPLTSNPTNQSVRKPPVNMSTLPTNTSYEAVSQSLQHVTPTEVKAELYQIEKKIGALMAELAAVRQKMRRFDLVKAPIDKKDTLFAAKILDLVSKKTCVPMEVLLSTKKGVTHEVEAKEWASSLCAEFTPLSLQGLAAFFCSPCHTTIKYRLQNVVRKCSIDKHYAEKYTELRNKVLQNIETWKS